MSNKSIGILDSGIGGLTVWRQIVELLPHESTVYVADSKNIPYGEKESKEIYALAERLVKFLIEREVKIIVVACNTISVSCLDKLRIRFPDIPIIGTVPVIKKAARVTKNKKIGIFSTTRTAESIYQKELIEKFASECEVVSVGSDEVVPLIEEGKIGSNEMIEALKRVLVPFKNSGVDTVCLGCTHFPFIEKEIQEVLDIDVLLLEPSSAIARHTKNILEKNNHLKDGRDIPKHNFYTTGNTEVFNRVAKSLLQVTIQAEHINI